MPASVWVCLLCVALNEENENFFEFPTRWLAADKLRLHMGIEQIKQEYNVVRTQNGSSSCDVTAVRPRTIPSSVQVWFDQILVPSFWEAIICCAKTKCIGLVQHSLWLPDIRPSWLWHDLRFQFPIRSIFNSGDCIFGFTSLMVSVWVLQHPGMSVAFWIWSSTTSKNIRFESVVTHGNHYFNPRSFALCIQAHADLNLESNRVLMHILVQVPYKIWKRNHSSWTVRVCSTPSGNMFERPIGEARLAGVHLFLPVIFNFTLLGSIRFERSDLMQVQNYMSVPKCRNSHTASSSICFQWQRQIQVFVLPILS